MTCLLVIAHPRKESLCRSLAGVARQALEARGLQVTVEDLYADEFSPVLTSQEWLAQKSTVALTAEMERLRAANVLILVFPTWWFGFPAILKGWFDRVWVPGVAFDVPAGGQALTPQLSRLEHVIAITSLGSPRWVDWLVLRQPVKRILKHALIGGCAPKARFHFLAAHTAETIDAARYEAFAVKIRRTVERLNLSSG